MPEKTISSLFRYSLVLTSCAALVVVAGVGARGQAGPAQVRMVERETAARQNEIESKTNSKRDPNEIMAEVNDDLRQLNQLNETLTTQAAAEKLDYDAILGSTLEVKKRSTRLRTDLALPKSDGKEKLPDFKDAEQGELKPALAALNQLLDSFLHNPIFGDTGAIDMQLAGKARRDLESIVVLSEKVRKNAEKRSKLSAKTQ